MTRRPLWAPAALAVGDRCEFDPQCDVDCRLLRCVQRIHDVSGRSWAGLFVGDSGDGFGAGAGSFRVSSMRDLRCAGTVTSCVPDSGDRAAAVAGLCVAGVDGCVAD